MAQGPPISAGPLQQLLPEASAASYPHQVRLSCKGFSTPGKLLPHKRSSRLAAKHKGVKKSSLFRAQDLMCRKHKFIRFAAKASRSLSLSSLAPPSPLGEPSAPLLLPLPEVPLVLPPRDPKIDEVSSKRRDLLSPLSLVEIRSIQAACGIPVGCDGNGDLTEPSAARLPRPVEGGRGR